MAERSRSSPEAAGIMTITVNNDGLWTYDRPTESTVEILTSDDICEIVALHNATVRRLRIELLKEVFARPE
jgi:hypothetical protein